MFRKNKKTAETERVTTNSVRGSKHTISTTPVVSEASLTQVKNPVDIDVPDDYNPANKYGLDDRLLAYFYTKTEIDEMDFGDAPDNSDLITGLVAAIADLEKRTKALEENQIGYGSQINALERHSHTYDGDITNDLPF